jgi:hypothetical protein
MRTAKRFRTSKMLAVAVSLLAGLAMIPAQMQAQHAGNNAVYNSGGTSVIGSPAIIDASVFANTSTTICATIYNILTGASGYGTYPSAGAVIDARGLTSSNSKLTCSSSPAESPWDPHTSGSTYADVPSVILLPAGTITISYTWVLPNSTKIVGQGASTPVTTGTQTGTVLTAASSFTGPASSYSPAAPVAMIQFGDPGTQTCGGTGVCFNISVEDLTLNNGGGTSQTIDGILNMDSQELTYARRVNLYGITGTGLQVGYVCASMPCHYNSQAQNSGPYEQIYYSSQTSTGHCAQIYGAPSRGIHGITCLASGNTGGGILLDSPSNSIEDASISGFGDGILVGSASSSSSRPWSNVLFDISGGTLTNLIHLCSATTSGLCASGTGAVAAQDITILGATSTSGNTIQDDVTGTTGTTLSNSTDPTVGMYALGEQVLISGTTTFGMSRFTTSPTVPSWYVGSTQSPSGSCSNGSIYSATGTSGSGTLWGCIAAGWVKLK